MIQKNVTEAKAELSKLLVLAEQGEEIVITRAGKPVVRLEVIEQKRPKRIYGIMKNEWKLPDDFDRQFNAADEEIARLMTEGEIIPGGKSSL